MNHQTTGKGNHMKTHGTKHKYIAAGLALIVGASLSGLPVHAEEVQNAWDEETRVHVLRRRVATAINVYTDGTSQDVFHEEGVLDGVIYDILRVNPTEHTFLQVDFSETPGFVNELKDPEIMLFMIIELVSSTCYSAILYSDPCDMDKLKPYLYDTVKLIIQQHRIS